MKKLIIAIITSLILTFIFIIITSVYAFSIIIGSNNNSSNNGIFILPEGVEFVDFPLLCDRYIVTSDFIDEEYYNQFGHYHHAIDLVGFIEGDNTNVPVVTLYNGVVHSVLNDIGASAGYGVIMYHEEMNLYILYCHFAYEPLVEVGQELMAGDIIGIQGTTGASTGIHLHLAFYLGGYGFDYKVDPRDYLELCDKGQWCYPLQNNINDEIKESEEF